MRNTHNEPKKLDRPDPRVPSPNPQPYERAVRAADTDPVREDVGEGSISEVNTRLVGRDYDPTLGREGRGSERRTGGLEVTPGGTSAQRSTPVVQYSDEQIFKALRQTLDNDKSVDARRIAVTVKSGEVTLRGVVPDRHELRAAESDALGIAGVRRVHNHLQLQP